MWTYLDDTTDELNNIRKPVEINIEVIQTILERLLRDDLAPLAHRTQTPQVACGVERRVRGLREVDLGQMRRHRGQGAL
jgi:hypothetical protein